MIKSEQIQIELLSKKRREIQKEYFATWDEKARDYSIEEPKEIEELAEQIYSMIYEYQKILTVEFIFEELTHLGDAPCLLYDDDGRFAVSGEGVQTVNISGEPQDMSLNHFIEKDMWKSTVREAIEYYLQK